MTYGPIDFIALEFKGNKFRGDILPELFELVNKEIIRIIDMVVILKDQDGEVTVLEMKELDPETISIFDPLHVAVTSIITRQDIDALAEQLENNSTAGAMLIENLWAVKTKEAMLAADGRLVMFERIPHDVVVEALADIAVLASSAG
jgi:hypothetical protein